VDRSAEKTVALVPAAGSGKRMGRDLPKLFLEMDSKPVIVHTLQNLESCLDVDGIVLAAHADHIARMEQLVSRWKIRKVIRIIAGGERRQDSVRNGLEALPDGCGWVAIHDGARPLISPQKVSDVIREAKIHGAAVCAVRTKDTLRIVEDGWIEGYLRRDKVWRIQTPQVFRLDWIRLACKKAEEDKIDAPDDATLVARLGHRIRIVLGEEQNLKITTPDDLVLAERIIRGAS
jgi:2-C-methyl-D-erythritol 4-phosphate cytidylyltransferase